MSMTPLEIALERIEKCRRTRSLELDLSWLGLEKIPEQVFELTWLETLYLSPPYIQKSDKEIEFALSALRLALSKGYTITPVNNDNQDNKISDLSLLRGLPQLRWLSCNRNEISDLSPLSGLPQLQTLHCSYNKISDLSPLRRLVQLETFSCGCNPISDFSPLSDLPQLQSLDCGDNDIENGISVPHKGGGGFVFSDLSLSNLLQLRSLDCSHNGIKHLTLNGLPQLQSLNCSCNSISHLTLNNLPQLQSLNCSDNGIKHLTLNGLPQLQSLNCSGNKISDLSSLSGLSQLQILSCGSNPISNFSPLSDLPQLQSLDCSNSMQGSPLPCDYIFLPFKGDLVISNLLQLRSLNCSNNEINQLTLDCLPQLQSLDCSYNQISNLASIDHVLLSGQLTFLSFYDNPNSGIPSVLLGNNSDDNCLEDLQYYRQAILSHGSVTQNQFKIQLVGNGRVGKTTLAYALEHKHAPREPFKPTHGIVIKEILQPLDGENEPVTLQLWDFGGQEIYHATHRLFLSDDCIYLLLWAEKTEEHPDETRHPVSYWLELIHDLAPNSPVIIIKNQIDRYDRLPTRPPDLDDISDIALLGDFWEESLFSSEWKIGVSPGVGQIWQDIKVSAMKYRGINTLRGAIQDLLAGQKHRVCLELPSSWINVQQELEKLKVQKSITFTHFKQLCIKAGIDHAEWFVAYLHRIGVLFFLKQDRIILDQNWIIEVAYRVFDTNKPHRRRIERMKGRFSGEDASLFWANEDTDEHKVYINFMRNCGICYEPYRDQNQQDNKPFTEREFIIPALLPLTSNAKAAWGNTRPDDWQFDIEYPFLHRSIIERIILRLGETYEGEPWRTGIFCHTDEGQLLLECEYTNKQQSTQGRLHFQLRGNHLDRLVYALRKLVSKTSPRRRYQEFLRKGNEERAKLSAFKENPQMPTPLDENKPASKTIKLFISYAHEDEKPYREELDKRLKAIKRQYPMLEPWHDRNLLAGEQVHNKILQQLEVADIVVLLISPDFVDSDYCFSHEMEIALKQYEQNQNIVIPIIIRDTADWHTYQIGNHVALPTDGKPLCDWSSPDKFWADVQQGIRKQVEKRLQT